MSNAENGYPELGYPLTDYGKQRLRAGHSVSFGSSDSDLSVRIKQDGDVEISAPHVIFTIPKDMRQNIADALLTLPPDSV